MTAVKTSTLKDDVAAFAEAQVAEGRYASVDEAVDATMRRDMLYEKKAEALRRAIDDGEASGDPATFDFKEFRARKLREHT
ncbi:MAG: type II toxin-antitoxin system ParD family antitoxin [Pseudomonadota bacterium]